MGLMFMCVLVYDVAPCGNKEPSVAQGRLYVCWSPGHSED